MAAPAQTQINPIGVAFTQFKNVTTSLLRGKEGLNRVAFGHLTNVTMGVCVSNAGLDPHGQTLGEGSWCLPCCQRVSILLRSLCT
eukprot:140836-Amphidinium_carterae.1